MKQTKNGNVQKYILKEINKKKQIKTDIELSRKRKVSKTNITINLYTWKKRGNALINRRPTPLQRGKCLVEGNHIDGDLGQGAGEQVVVDSRVVGRGLDGVVGDDIARSKEREVRTLARPIVFHGLILLFLSLLGGGKGKGRETYTL